MKDSHVLVIVVGMTLMFVIGAWSAAHLAESRKNMACAFRTDPGSKIVLVTCQFLENRTGEK